MADATFNVPGNTRGKELKVIAYAKELWSEAQQKESKLLKAVRKVDMLGSSYRMFDRSKKMDLVAKNGGIVATPENTKEFSRIALFCNEYHNSVKTDRSDIVDSSQDILGATRMELMRAQGRKIDEVILAGLVSLKQRGNDATYNSAQRVTATGATTETANDIIFADTRNNGGTKRAAGALPGFDVDYLEAVIKKFNDSEVEGTIVCAMNQELLLKLRTDSDFKNRENVYSVTDQLQGTEMGIHYKGINFIYVSAQRFPLLSTSNIGDEAAGTNTITSGVDISVRDINTASALPTETTKAIVQGAASASRAIVTAKSTSIAYFWKPEALIFATRPELTFARMDELPHASYAKQFYMRVALGAVLLDATHAIGFVFDGTIKTVHTGS